jgi:lysophospholipase L1-like esterase
MRRDNQRHCFVAVGENTITEELICFFQTIPLPPLAALEAALFPRYARMMFERFIIVLGAVTGLALLAGCSSRTHVSVITQVGESAVLIKEEPAALAHFPLRDYPLRVRSAYPPSPAIEYVAGRDFIVDFAAGTLRRMAGSRIPDFHTNLLFGREQFDHTKFPGYGNRGFFVFIDYSFENSNCWPVQRPQTNFLKATQVKLSGGDALKIIAFGDSITAGGEASRPDLIFWQRWANELQRRHPCARVTAVNGATGGDTTVRGLARLQTKVIEEKPDLVLIGFGMNDNNQHGVPITEFERNLREMITRIRAGTGAEVVLFSAFPPNPKWLFGSPHMADYAAATGHVATETGCAYADVYDNWQMLAARKKPEDMLGNNINHPNDFGHWIYFRVFEELGL